MTKFSVLDLAPVTEGSTPGIALQNSLDLARHAEKWGFERYWVAEHHNMKGIASAATAVVIGHIAGGTSTIRVGAGGIMLPNHAPLIIAEQFGTLASLYPDRIDLGLGRAPGTDQLTAQALRRTLTSTDVGDFPRDVVELQHYLKKPQEGQQVTAVPGYGTEVPLWILGSSLFGAQLAAMLGLPYAFASHFAPGAMDEAIQIYRDRFEPSEQLQEPYVMLGYNICAADTDEEANFQRSSSLQSFVNLRRGTPGQLQPPIPDFEATLSPSEIQMINDLSRCAAVGAPHTVKGQIEKFIAETKADELIMVCSLFEHSDRLRSYEITAEVAREINDTTGVELISNG
jgi:luciferase family oxidoreductase group 1